MEAIQKEEAHQEVNKEALVHDLHPSNGEIVQEVSNEVDEDSLLYDSYDSEDDYIVTDGQRDLLISKWGEGVQQQILKKSPKLKDEAVSVVPYCRKIHVRNHR